MNKYMKLVLGMLVLLVLIGGSTFVYKALVKQYGKDVNMRITAKGEQKEQGEKKSDMETLDFIVLNAENEEVALSSMKGKPLVLNIWASWCGPCKMEMPHFQSASELYGEEVEFMMVNLTDGYRETREIAEAFIADSGYTFPVYYDENGNASETFIVRSIPFTYFFDKEGNIQTKVIGAMDEKALHDAIALISQ